MSVVERVRVVVLPILSDLGLELYDLEHAGGSVRVLVDRPGGADLEAIAEATRMISRELDKVDPMPGRYTLEVSTPGLERPLRTVAHFQRAVGTTVTVRTQPDVEGERRVQGLLQTAADEGITVLVPGGSEVVERHLRYDQIERAKTVFEWGSGVASAPRKKAAS